MGNLLSVHQQGHDGRLHICDRCGFQATHKTALRVHRAHQCRLREDGRYVHARASVTLRRPAHSHTDQQQQHDGHEHLDHGHEHHHHGQDCCDEEQLDQTDSEQLRNAINEQVQQYMQETGEELCPESAAALADLLLGIMCNGKTCCFLYQLSIFIIN